MSVLDPAKTKEMLLKSIDALKKVQEEAKKVAEEVKKAGAALPAK